MKKILIACLIAGSVSLLGAAEPLRVFIRGGKKSHGPGAHEHERFLRDWTQLLGERSMKVSGAMDFPTPEQLVATDVLLMYAQDGGTVPQERRGVLDQYLKRGGGIVVIHTASVSADSAHWKSIIGGAWVNGTTKWLEGPMSLYYADNEHPITMGASNFDLDDEIYYDMDLSPNIRVLAAAYTPKTSSTRNSKKADESTAAGRRASVYDIQPQMWTYERTIEGGVPYRAFVSIPGHLYTNFARPNYRAVLLRGIAWAGKRRNLDEFTSMEELASLRYPEGGPTAPDKASLKLEIHPDFNISLVAAEPLITKPININWDAQGRLWVAETPEYPNGRKQPNVEPWKDSGSLMRNGDISHRPARDRISILTDTDGDGRLDKKQIFYEGLELVTSFVFYKDGVIASAAPDIWLIRDNDGDGRAGSVMKLYTGLGTNDTHAVINNLRWGFDGWIYATHGYSATEHVMSGDRRKDFGRIGSGVVRFKPDGSAFEQYCSKGGNTWGLDISWDNEVFFTQPTSGDLLNHVVLPEYILARGQVAGARSYKPQIVRRKSYPLMTYEKQAYVQIDLVGSFTASAGCAIYDGGAWPSEWNYSYFTTEPTINLIHHEVVKPDGVSYIANKVREPEFIAGRDMWFRPIETRIGPDGALYICDFYNQAVVHNDTRGPRHGPANAAVRPDRDHYFGRLWRVDHKESKKLEIPNLAAATPAQLVKALEHPNSHIRMTAHRLITEKGAGMPSEQFLKTFSPDEANIDRSNIRWNIHWQWILATLNLQRDAAAPAPLRENPEWRKNSLRVLTAMGDSSSTKRAAAPEPVPRDATGNVSDLIGDLSHPNARVSLDAILALTRFADDKRVSSALVSLYPQLEDSWRQSAVIGVVAQAPDRFLAEALAASSPEKLKDFVATLCNQTIAKTNSSQLVALVTATANARARADSLKEVALATITRGLNAAPAPDWTPQLQNALQKLLHSANVAIPAATLPLVARWDKQGTLSEDVKPLVQRLTARLADTSLTDNQRAQVVTSLLPVRQMNPEILPTIGGLLGPPASPELQRRVVDALGATADPAIGSALATAYGRLDPNVRPAALAQLLKRADWSLAFLDALQSGAANVDQLGPADFHRLRTHSDLKVSARANELWAKARGGAGQEKDALIAKFTPLVTQRGDVKKGKELFTVNCSACHKLDDLGNEVGPVLTGMGAHGPAELLVHILDPNREVDPSFVAYNIETTDGEIYDGIIVRDNPARIALRNAAGEKEIPVAQIKSRQSSGRSLMPEGFEALGEDGLRDLLAFICASESRYRFVDLTSAFTADSRRGIYTSQDAIYDTLKFKKFGAVTVNGVPFNIVDSAKTISGKNLIVLKGGASGSFSRSLPKRVEAKLGFAATKLHFLGGVAGWGYPGGGEDVAVMKVTVQYTGGQTEELIFKNGDEFADYIRVVDVPGSTLAEGVVTANQLRYFSKPLKRSGIIEKLIMESFDNGVAPTTVAVTAELAGAPATASAEKGSITPSAAAPFTWDKPTRVLLVGGGSSHDFNRFFNQADSRILQEIEGVSVHYTEDSDVAARELLNVNVAILSVNKEGFAKGQFRQALLRHVDAGKGMILLHPGVWYNWRDWPEYNRVLAGGGSRGHDAPLEFEVKLTETTHPLIKGLPPSFKITDELYWFDADPKGTPIEVLATTHSPKKDKDYPMIWIVKHPKARIAGIALGHDARAHDLPEFKQLLKNAVTWAADAPPRSNRK